MLGYRGGDSGVKNVPSVTGSGCLGSGGKPTAVLLRQRGVAVLVSLTCRQGRMGIRECWVGGELFSVHWQREHNQSVVEQEGHVRQEKKKSTGE